MTGRTAPMFDDRSSCVMLISGRILLHLAVSSEHFHHIADRTANKSRKLLFSPFNMASRSISFSDFLSGHRIPESPCIRFICSTCPGSSSEALRRHVLSFHETFHASHTTTWRIQLPGLKGWTAWTRRSPVGSHCRAKANDRNGRQRGSSPDKPPA